MDSPKNAGGAALYEANSLKAVPKPDIKFDVALVECCWADIDAGEGKKKIILGFIYTSIPLVIYNSFVTNLIITITKFSNLIGSQLP